MHTKKGTKKKSVPNDGKLIDALRRSLGDHAGRLRVADAFLLCGIDPGKATQDQIQQVGRTLRELGWERQRRSFDGVRTYAYVKGTRQQREEELVVEYDHSIHVEHTTN
jgi:hypothetical protein